MDRSNQFADYYEFYQQKQHQIGYQSKSKFEKYVSAPKFDWETKWLKGQEYAHMLYQMDKYCESYNFRKYQKKNHPDEIYTNPENGMIYYVEGNSVGSDFGFPRVDLKKKYRWKKMNFTTDLPKKRPLVTYIVASAVKCEKFFPNSKNEGPSYRMHAVILYVDSNQKNAKQKQYILCHIRKIDQNYKMNRNSDSFAKRSLQSTDIIKKKVKKIPEHLSETTDFGEGQESTDSQNVEVSKNSVNSFSLEPNNLRVKHINNFSQICQFTHQNELNQQEIINEAMKMSEQNDSNIGYQSIIINELNRKFFLDPILIKKDEPESQKIDYHHLFNLLNSSFG